MIPWSQGKHLLWDFTCCDTLAASHCHQNSQRPASAAEVAEQRKFDHYSDLQTNFIFAPISMETLGSIGSQSKHFLKDLCGRLVLATGNKQAGAFFKQRLSMAVQRGNVVSITGTIPESEQLTWEE